jgi:hypothetical protein
MFAFYTSMENSLFLVGHLAMLASGALVTVKYADWSVSFVLSLSVV